VLEGATLVLPDGKQIPSLAGDVRINQRDIPHGRFKGAGDKPLKMLTVYIVDKGKPLTEPAKQTVAVRTSKHLRRFADHLTSRAFPPHPAATAR